MSCFAILIVGAVASGVFSLHGRLWQQRRNTVGKSAATRLDAGIREKTPDFNTLVQWIRDDREIDKPSLDMFGHDSVARRIVRRLKTDINADPPTMAVVGPVGSGKTSIGALVAHHLRSDRSTCWVSISLWHFNSPDAAARGILDTLVTHMSSHVNTLGLRGLSQDYVSAVAGIPGWWGVLARLLDGVKQPLSILDRLSAVALSTGIRMVLWIEDFERFSDSRRLLKEQAALRDAERLGPVRALLYMLDRCDCITIIVADTSLESRFDIDKIARFVEHPPRIGVLHAWYLIEKVREHCLNGWPKEIIDPANPAHRKKLAPPEDPAVFMIGQRMHDDGDPTVPEAIAILLDTPRSLKNALRLTCDTWKTLAGEIDFDDLLIMSVVRVARPRVFSFIDSHIDLFRSGFKRWPQQDDPIKHPSHQAFENLLAEEQTLRQRGAVRCLVRFVFPGLPEEKIIKDTGDEYISRPQGLHVDRHVDYWTRNLSTPVVLNNRSDQAALGAIQTWQQGDPSDLVGRMIDPDKSDQIETFVGRFKPSELCRLLEDVAGVVSEQDAGSWKDKRDAPGITSVWRMMNRRPPRDELVAQTVERCMQRFVPVHLPLAHDIYYYYGTRGASTLIPLVTEEQSTRITSSLHDLLVSSFSDEPVERLLCALRSGSPYLLYWLSWSIGRNPANPTDSLPFEQWPEFGSTLLATAEYNPSVGLLQILPFVTGGDHRQVKGFDQDTETDKRWMEFVANFDEGTARRLFDFDRLLPLFVNTPAPEGLDPNLSEMWRAATDAAGRLEEGS